MTDKKHSLEIIHKIKLAGSSQAAIARQHHVKPTAVWNVIWGRSESKAIKRIISKITGVRIEDVSPRQR
jgi:lambda repressor-like predicted transcriptional regulator